VFTHKHHTDIAYLACARALIGHNDVVYPQFATHNAGTIAAILQMGSASDAKFEMQRLHGMGEGVYREVMKDTQLPVRVYAPVGEHRDLLAYLVRRPAGERRQFILRAPARRRGGRRRAPARVAGAPGEVPSQPAPVALYGWDGTYGRRNSAGVDLAVVAEREPLERAVMATTIERLDEATPADVDAAMSRLHAGHPRWDTTPLAERAAVLRRAGRCTRGAPAAVLRPAGEGRHASRCPTPSPKCAKR
jgi:RHH-type proline utilization regulon transcriptional repressor/proline dehydrogenase/delta 1-pyrroline-5-carboxylate dehydrogenase